MVHRDLKPENFLLDASGNLKLIDFGLAVTHQDGVDAPLGDVVGSPFYMAPEVLKQSYGKSCDVWSMGVMAYILLTGRPPYGGDTDYEVVQTIQHGSLDLRGVAMSAAAKDFVAWLLQRDPRRRCSATQALQHPWIQQQLARN